MNRFARRLRMLKWQNWPMTLGVVALLVIGVLFVYSSSFVSDDQPANSLYRKQLVWALVGIVCYLGFAMVDYHRLRALAWWFYGVALVLLVAVPFFGTRVYGAKRWLSMFGLSIQPAELAKLAVILLLARKLSEPGQDFGRARPVLEMLAIVAAPVVLIMKQPDLGTALIFLPVAFAMMFVAGVPGRTLGIMALTGALGAAVLLGALFLPEKMGMDPARQKEIVRMVGLSEYHRDRLMVFAKKSDKYRLGAGWNKLQSEIAVGSGGLWGKGFLKGTQNILGFLPRSVSPNDFIYSVIAEETGFVGSVVVLALFGLVLTAGTLVAFLTRNRMGRCLCVGVVALLFCHVFVNIAMTVGLLPVTGIPLPLLSYGGTFIVTTMSALGMVQSVNIRLHRA